MEEAYKIKIHEKNKKNLLEKVGNFKKIKLENWLTEEYGMKNYIKSMNLSQARTLFSARAEVLPTIQMNFKNKPEFAQNLWKCKCGDLDTQSHLAYCRSYEHLREGLDILQNDLHLVLYYQRVIKERERDERDGGFSGEEGVSVGEGGFVDDGGFVDEGNSVGKGILVGEGAEYGGQAQPRAATRLVPRRE